jgi:transcriptional regulator with PAS, ATPase and Fis domain
MSPAIQSKLLTVIERREIYPVGSTSPTNIDIRIIAATNRDIRQSVSEKEFRTDLFYRLGEFIITIPPLRERTDDIPFFAQKFLAEACAEMKKQIRGMSDEAQDFLLDYAWPGNLRELKTVMKKAVLFACTDIIDLKILEPLIEETCSSNNFLLLPLKDEIRELEKKRISDALIKKEGNKTRAADLLGISRKSFIDKLKEYKIS